MAIDNQLQAQRPSPRKGESTHLALVAGGTDEAIQPEKAAPNWKGLKRELRIQTRGLRDLGLELPPSNRTRLAV